MDLVAVGRAGACDVGLAPMDRLPRVRGDADAVVVIGNTRAAWPRFVEALRADPARIDSAAPWDAWARAEIEAALEGLEVQHIVRWAHGARGARFVAQRVAEACGLAWRAPSYLSVHPRVGSWFGLRAAVVLGVDGPEVVPEPSPCVACTEGCRSALERAQVGEGDWRAWLAVRDACPIGRAWRYSEAQIAYHYTHDRAILRRAVAQLALAHGHGVDLSEDITEV